MKNKRGQGTMSMPFEVIFSIMLIIVFIVIAFIAIKYFLNIQKCGEVGKFYENLQGKVDDAFGSGGVHKRTFDIELPSGVTKVCFANFSKPITRGMEAEYEEIQRNDVYDANIFLLPPSESCSMEWSKIENIDLNKILVSANPYCIGADKKISVEFNLYDKGVVLRAA